VPTEWCNQVGCDGEIPYEVDGGEVCFPSEDGEPTCPKCGTVFKHLGEDWDVTQVYLEPVRRSKEGTA
jgi:hypothetical protein